MGSKRDSLALALSVIAVVVSLLILAAKLIPN